MTVLAEMIGGSSVGTTSLPKRIGLRERVFQKAAGQPSPDETPITPQNYIFLLGGPSGSGKSSLKEKLNSVLAVPREITRSPRPVPYDDPSDLAVSFEEFQARKDAGYYLFTYEVPFVLDATGEHPAQYGIPRSIVDTLRKTDLIVSLAAAKNVRAAIDAFRETQLPIVPLLVTPDCSDDLEARLTRRFTDEQDRATRLAAVSEEFNNHYGLARDGTYWHVLHNNDVRKMREEWKEKGAHFQLKPFMERATYERIDDVFGRLSEIVTFYQAIKGRVPIEPSAILKTYVDYCCRAIFGYDQEELTFRLDRVSRGIEPPIKLNSPEGAAAIPWSAEYIQGKYPLAEIRIEGDNLLLVLSHDVLKDDVKKMDRYLRGALGPELGHFLPVNLSGDRTFSLTDEPSFDKPEGIKSVTVVYAPSKK